MEKNLLEKIRTEGEIIESSQKKWCPFCGAKLITIHKDLGELLDYKDHFLTVCSNPNCCFPVQHKKIFSSGLY